MLKNPLATRPIESERTIQAGRFAYHVECGRPTDDEPRGDLGRDDPTHGPHHPGEPVAGVAGARTIQRRPYQVLSFVEWCGHAQEVVLVAPRGMVREVPVLGEAS